VVVNYLWTGLSNGSMIALMALGFCLVYRTFSIFNLAYACVFVAAGYSGYFFTSTLGWPILPSAMLGVLIATGLGCAIDWVVYRPLTRKGAGWNILFVASIGIYIFLSNAFAVIFGSSTQILVSGGSGVWHLGFLQGNTIQFLQVIALMISGAALFVLLRRTHSGRAIKALGDNEKLASTLGCNTGQVRLLVFLISSFFAGVAGILNAIDIGVTPHAGMGPVLGAAVATMIAGRRNLLGTAIAGILIGVIQSFTVMFWEAKWQEFAIFVLLAAVLLIRREGLFTLQMRAEES